MRRREAILDIYTSTLGAILFLSPWLFAFPVGTMRADAWISGAIICLLSGLAIFAFAEWEEWTNLLIGCWIVVSPWVLGFAHTGAMRVAVIVGLIIAYLSLMELWLIHFSVDPPQRAPKN
jgi:hypothetical protein